jgi:hypothetical protein
MLLRLMVGAIAIVGVLLVGFGTVEVSAADRGKGIADPVMPEFDGIIGLPGVDGIAGLPPAKAEAAGGGGGLGIGEFVCMIILAIERWIRIVDSEAFDLVPSWSSSWRARALAL